MPWFSLNRLLFTGISIAGFAAVATGILQPWFSVPVASCSGAESMFNVAQSIPACTAHFKAATAVGILLLIASWIWNRGWTFASACIASALLLIALAFPYFVVIRSPEISADAAWLQMQHDNLTWLGGDIYLNAEFGGKGWRSKTYIVDAPRRLTIVSLPSWSPWELGLHHTEDLIEWLGYSNAFCQFVKRGWSLTIVGIFLLFASTLQHNGQLVLKRACCSVAFFFSVCALSAFVGCCLPFMASKEIRIASEYFRQGEYQRSRQHLDHAVDLLPVLGQDTFYVAQRGVLDNRMRVESQYAQLLDAKHLEDNARYDRAYQRLATLARSTTPAVQREALRGILRFAIQDYNCGRFELSSERLSFVLRQNPCDVKVIYLMQLQAIRESRTDRVRELKDWMYAATECFNFNTKKVLRATSQQHLVTAVGFDDDAYETWSSISKAKRP